MRVGWLADKPPYVGGAELTQAEFRAAAPDDVEVVDCPAGEVVPGLDHYCIFNCVGYSYDEVISSSADTRITRFWSDVAPEGSRKLTRWLLDNATNVFCSPLHLEKFPHPRIRTPRVIPPPVDLDRFRVESNGRKGTCWLGRLHPSKGVQQAIEWAEANGRVDFYGVGPYMPPSPFAEYVGPIPYDKAPETLARYQRLVFLPVAFEPFGRVVAEAWASGMTLIVNRNIGAIYWIKEQPEKLETAAEDFWRVVRDGR
jgi:glycosyltransferase involved in cell wall biosynthesis